MIVLLDPNLILDFENSPYTKTVLDFIDNYLDIKVQGTKEIFSFISNYSSAHTQYLNKTNNAFVLRKFQKLLFDPNNCISSFSCNAQKHIPSNFVLTNDTSWDTDFNNLIDYFITNKEEIIIFLSPKNHNKNITWQKTIYSIEDIYHHAPSKIPELLFIKKVGKESSLLVPEISNPLPNCELNRGFEEKRNEIRTQKILNTQKTTWWLIYGKEVAERNGYKLNSKLSKKNTSNAHKRKIFEKNNIYASLDIEHGAIEILDKNGHWLDEYSYDGNKNPCTPTKRKKNEINHSITI